VVVYRPTKLVARRTGHLFDLLAIAGAGKDRRTGTEKGSESEGMK